MPLASFQILVLLFTLYLLFLFLIQMKKIFILLSVLVVIVFATKSARALFSSQAKTASLTFTTGNADLQISADSQNWSNTLAVTSDHSNMSSGYNSSQDFYLKNNSLSPISLKISVRLEDFSPTENAPAWPIIGDKIHITFQKFTDNQWTNVATASLKDWRDSAKDLDTLSQNTASQYRFQVTLDDVDNTHAGQSLSNLSFKFTGLQSP